jgi:hypothetical protein
MTATCAPPRVLREPVVRGLGASRTTAIQDEPADAIADGDTLARLVV